MRATSLDSSTNYSSNAIALSQEYSRIQHPVGSIKGVAIDVLNYFHSIDDSFPHL